MFYLGNKETWKKSIYIYIYLIFLIKNSYIFLILVKNNKKTNHKKTYTTKHTMLQYTIEHNTMI